MEMEEIEAVLERIWDLHDKLSDAIHSITRSHFLNSVKSLRNSEFKKSTKENGNDAVENNNGKGGGGASSGFVYVKECKADDAAVIEEAKSLNAIRTALENLEDQLEFLHTVQAQQRAERDAAIARLEQSRVVLAMRLAEHHGKKYKVIEEALAFVGEVGDASRFVSPENMYGPTASLSGENYGIHETKRPNFLHNIFISSLDIVKRCLKLNHVSGLLGNTALFAFSMVALLHLHHATDRKHLQNECDNYYTRKTRNKSWMEGSSTSGNLGNLNVLLARG